MKLTGWGKPGHDRGFSRSVLSNVSYYKIHEYIWFKGEDLNGF